MSSQDGAGEGVFSAEGSSMDSPGPLSSQHPSLPRASDGASRGALDAMRHQQGILGIAWTLLSLAKNVNFESKLNLQMYKLKLIS